MKNAQDRCNTSNKGTKQAKSESARVTARRVIDFYRTLGLSSLRSLPVGEFKLYDQVEITQSAGSGV